MPEKKQNNFPIASAIEKYIECIESFSITLPMSMMVVSAVRTNAIHSFRSFIKEKNIEKEVKSSEVSYKINMEDFSKFQLLKKQVDSIFLSERMIPESFFVSLISHFDSFIGDLIRAIFKIKPEILNSSEKQMTFSELMTYPDIEAAREYIIEKEIETVLRNSHAEHFCWLEKKLKVELKKDKVLWGNFIELTERRNLFVHNNGIVSAQYLSVCADNNVPFQNRPKIGDQLEMNPEYFNASYSTLYEIAVKLSYVIWRKLAPEESESADRDYNGICYELISLGSYELAIKLLEFVLTNKIKQTELSKKTFIINLAQAYKWLGNQDKVLDILSEDDWSACNNEFKLATYVLQDDFENVFAVMDMIGNDKDMRIGYKEWPLFKELRKEKKFIAKYKTIFNEEFCVTEFEDAFKFRKMSSNSSKIKKTRKSKIKEENAL